MADGKLDITDELLVAYVDDELDEAQSAMVRSVLETSPALCQRAEEMRLSRDLLREAFPLLSACCFSASFVVAASRLADACAKPASRRARRFQFRNGWKYATAAAVMLGMAVSAG